MIRGIRGATTVKQDSEDEVVKATEHLLREIVERNQLQPEDVSHIWFTLTEDLVSAFPAKATRRLTGWDFVPVMCAQEIPVPNSLARCIRIMVTAETSLKQIEVEHVYHNEAVQLRPDLQLTKKDSSR
ncbi:chorismate mutase [Salsuginibacillus kocurii]|uniref:chorismate mutase n=1 Tax=Salsuginibacillus kocurii TaxID=427078 RepID=UPI00035F191F|nr:chorismate mutase [Salsuginibacillus kocurii]